MTHPQHSEEPLLSVIIPCLNEEKNILALTERLLTSLQTLTSFECIFIDDGSQDKTWSAIQQVASQYPSLIRCSQNKSNEGIEASWRQGLKISRGRFICLIDADLQNPPEEISRLLHLLHARGADLAQGSRLPAADTDKRRLFLSRSLNWLLNNAFGMKLQDNKSGFVVMKREVFKSILQHRFRYEYFQCLIAVAAHSKGFSIVETPTPFLPRLHGVSFMGRFPLKVILGCLGDVARGVIEYRLGAPMTSRSSRERHATTSSRTSPGGESSPKEI